MSLDGNSSSNPNMPLLIPLLKEFLILHDDVYNMSNSSVLMCIYTNEYFHKMHDAYFLYYYFVNKKGETRKTKNRTP